MSESSASSQGSTRIAVEYITDERPRVYSDIERKMEQEAETVLREWDENIQRRSQDSLHIRPKSTSSPSGAERRRKRTSNLSTPNSAPGGTGGASGASGSTSTSFEFPEINLIKREESAFDTSAESLDDDNTRQSHYRECPNSGQRIFHIEFEVHGYEQKNISVKISGSRLIVHAIQKESADGKKSTTEFCRKVKVPKDVDTHKLQCTHCNGLLIVEAPVLSASSLKSPATPSFLGGTSPTRMDPINTPLIKPSTEGKSMNILVEIGRVFKADDVVVKLKGQDKLIVSAQRDESNVHSKMSASLSREFDLPDKIQPQTLKAGLTTDGLLKVSALLTQQDENGHHNGVVVNGE